MENNTLDSNHIFNKFKEKGDDNLTQKEKLEFFQYIHTNEGKIKMYEYQRGNPKIKEIAQELNNSLEKKLSLLQNELSLSGVSLAEVFFQYIAEEEKEKILKKNQSNDLSKPFFKALENELEITINKFYLNLYDLIIEDSKNIDDNIIELFTYNFHPEKTISGMEFFEKKLFDLIEKKYHGYKLAENFLTYRNRKIIYNKTECIKFKSPSYHKAIDLIKKEAEKNNADALYYLYDLSKENLFSSGDSKLLEKAALNGHELAIDKVVYEYRKDSKLEDAIALLDAYKEKIQYSQSGFAFSEIGNTKNRLNQLYLSVLNEKKDNELSIKNKHLEEAQKRLRELVQNTSHLAGNLLRPNTQEKIAKKLKNSEFSEESKKLYYASSDIKYVKQQFKLLEIMQSLTGSEAITSQIKLDQVDKSNNQSMSIEDILNLAAFRAIDKLFDTNEYSLNFARETIEKKQGDFSKLSNEYQKYVLATNDDNYRLSIISWCSKNLRPITINYKCDDWKKILFYNNSQSVALFFCYFFELFFNAFKYADHNEYDFLTITLANEFIDDNEFLTMIWTNPKGNQVSFGSNKGLNLSASYISLLNDDKYKDKSQELIAHADNTFELITRIDRKIFNL